MGGEESKPVSRAPSHVRDSVPGRPQCLLDTPFREYQEFAEWTPECRSQLQERTLGEKAYENVDFKSYKILILGPCGAGKSSFKNTLKSAFLGEISYQTDAGYDATSLTRKFSIGPIRGRDGKSLGHFRFADMPGLEYITIDDVTIGGLLDGRLPHGTEIHNGRNPQLREEIKAKHRIHCIVVMIDGSKIDMMDQPQSDIFKVIKKFRAQARQRDIPIAAVVTHLDKLCGCFSEDLQKVFSCKTVKDTMLTMSQKLAIDANRVFAHQSYTKIDHINVNPKIDCLTLITLKHLLQYCREYTDNWLDSQGIDDDD